MSALDFWLWLTTILVSALASHLGILGFWRASLTSALFAASVMTAFSFVRGGFSFGTHAVSMFIINAVIAFAVANLVGVRVHEHSSRHRHHDNLLMHGEQGRRRTKLQGGIVFCFGLFLLCMSIYSMFFGTHRDSVTNIEGVIIGGLVMLVGAFFLFVKQGITPVVEWFRSGRFWNQ